MSVNRRAALRMGMAGGAAAIIDTASASGDPASGATSPAAATSDAALVGLLAGDFHNGYAEVNGTMLHYVTGGQGAPLVLLPGWPQTWWQFRKIMPELARHFHVIAVDLRGMNSSGKPTSGYDKKTMATDIHQLTRQLGYDQVNVAGHDIGSMVAFSLAANYPSAVRRLTMMDVAHPDESLNELTMLPRPGETPLFLWWFAFNQVQLLPEELLTGRFRFLTDYLCGVILLNQAAIDERARTVYANAYSAPEAIRAGNGWYQTFGQDILDVGGYSRLTLPIQAMYSQGNPSLIQSLATRATTVESVEVRDSGHYLAEEQPEAVTTNLIRFLAS